MQRVGSDSARPSTTTFPGFYGWVRDWDVGGTYTDTVACPECGGSRLRREYLSVTLGGRNIHELSMMRLSELARLLEDDLLPQAHLPAVRASLDTARRRLRFLSQVGLGYLHLDRVASTLSAGEAQRARLAGLLGSGLTSLTVLLDEPTRGLHPAEVDALLAALTALRDEGNTVIVVEHDPLIIRSADFLIEMGPGAGTAGGEVVAQGAPADFIKSQAVTAAWLRGERGAGADHGGVRARREPKGWLTIRGARANNLAGETIRLPLGVLAGICGVSGSGKSTLLIDTLGRALAPRKQTTSVAYEPIEPGEHDAIEGAPRAPSWWTNRAAACTARSASSISASRCGRSTQGARMRRRWASARSSSARNARPAVGVGSSRWRWNSCPTYTRSARRAAVRVCCRRRGTSGYIESRCRSFSA